MSAKARILVVEDDPLISLDVSQALKGFGYDVIGTANTGLKAIEAYKSGHPDLVLMDINLKDDMDGIEAAGKINAERPTAVVFLTALSDEATLQRAKLTGPFGYLIKPFDPAELHSTIEIALSRFAEKSPAGAGDASDSPFEEETLVLESAGDPAEKAALLQKLPFLRELSSEAIQKLAAFGEVNQFDAGEFIHIEENEPERAFIVLTGRVSVTKSSPAGKELILSLLGPADCFGLLYLLPGFGKIASSRTQLDSKIFSFKSSHFTQIRKAVPEILDALNTELVRRLSSGYDLAISLAHSRVETRILNTLMTLVTTMAKTSPTAADEARIFITRKELADLTGTTPETAIRVTKQLERDGILDLARPGIIKVPDINKLRDWTRQLSAN